MLVVGARYFLIAMAVILAPLYGLWIFCGFLADRAGQRRSPEIMKGAGNERGRLTHVETKQARPSAGFAAQSI